MNNNITAIILVALAIGTYLTFTRAKLAEVNEVRVVNTQYLSAIDSADRLIKVRDAVLKDYNALSSEDRDRLDKMLPNTVDNIRLIIDLNSVALRHGFSLRDIKAAASNANQGGLPASQGFGSEIGDAGASIPTPTLDTVNISFSVMAPYQQFINLLRDLEANLRIMDVTHLSVSAGTNPNLYDFSVELQTYWLRQQ
ncbi:MAG: hypothetical protein A3C79_02610 [Candidatus Taylorbacteria bacterium RIFCSPHIGHO2_02_FULL_45_28]|uniref:Pilus assembly protein PilO n=1 Tax=Candidatus Taylorbacteria bacterium RIFCSPHIGHO2_12_FULL_45_16 TaxID=1802315 RepID=A0A1G2MY19_9BACT|nr:MAG: hypothetical protein A2830_03415 [Candidatus Taylorbacteria bacterium RIFCSPHIGHO2_01_FULL_44_110]OHA25341.1 MAG: hypothetical protein A3C79_02610 [Candidatus Taylorbacteria bacterium RIFCSPHIGHO2_02_FULL_45_28]OHA28728.1 MAG: hypothetical protein A3F51_03075 [Candidatus Taylorbacteria bacterium RIFCSPHIGHO2_12_FULL_45_16]OHA33001.1 MAG: hypothetical protein A3A23_01255 [Candidatus Taylorbacteria bacterium RIFCSPLOWO2_01_FULL_45_59]OHA39670.1 MAG: hypothetical protein A3I98_00975 [Candi